VLLPSIRAAGILTRLKRLGHHVPLQDRLHPGGEEGHVIASQSGAVGPRKANNRIRLQEWTMLS